VSTPGLFERHGTFPSMRSVAEITRREGARHALVYLTARGVLSIDWDLLSEADRETWVTALADEYQRASREASKAAVTELKEYEELAVTLECRRCGAREGTPCWDMRPGRRREHVKHHHQERMDDLAEELS
jgi:hypothetical protein